MPPSNPRVQLMVSSGVGVGLGDCGTAVEYGTAELGLEAVEAVPDDPQATHPARVAEASAIAVSGVLGIVAARSGFLWCGSATKWIGSGCARRSLQFKRRVFTSLTLAPSASHLCLRR